MRAEVTTGPLGMEYASNGSENESKCGAKMVVIALLIGTFAGRTVVMVMMELACIMTQWYSLIPLLVEFSNSALRYDKARCR